jgi:hypothetical protein
MISLCATFEDWLIIDGDYPPLAKGQKVNFSFKIFQKDYEIVEKELYIFDKIKHSEYSFSGKIIYKCDNIIVVDTLSFKFYIEIERNNIANICVGQFIKGSGTLHVDYYRWVMNLNRYENHPDIFYNFVVENIFKVIISKKHIVKVSNGIRFPCSLSSDEYNNNDLKEVKKMNSNTALLFYLLNLSEVNETVEKTYIGGIA